MRTATVILLTLCLAGTAMASDLGNRMPTDKPAPQIYEPPGQPILQGGDTIFDATVIPSVPYSNSGTTAGYFDDYDEVCPYSSSTSPDVVYTYEPAVDEIVDIDLCGSAYDTKLYVYDENLALVACNDDFYFDDICGPYVSKLECVALTGGVQYFIVIDGYGGDFGNYLIELDFCAPCVIDCPVGAELEGEPPLVPNYVDLHNGGCNSPPGYPFQEILSDAAGNATFCGVSGWYTFSGLSYRDTDWFLVGMGPSGVLQITIDAEYATYMFELGPQSCAGTAIIQQVIGGPCLPATMTITGYLPQDPVWIWVGPTVFSGPVNEYDYVLHISGASAIENEQTTWGGVKSMYR